MSIEINSWSTIIDRHRGLIYGSMGGIGTMGGGTPPPPKRSMVFCSPLSLDLLMLTLFSCLILLGSSTKFSLNREGKFPSFNREVTDETSSYIS